MKSTQRETLMRAENVIFYRIPEGTVRVEKTAFKGCTEIGEVYIPKSLVELDASVFEGLEKLEMIRAHRDHPILLSLDGVLYTRGGELLLYPRGRRNDTFRVPEKITGIRPGAFRGQQNLTELYIPMPFIGSDEEKLLEGIEVMPEVEYYERDYGEWAENCNFVELTRFRYHDGTAQRRTTRSFYRGDGLVRSRECVSLRLPDFVRHIGKEAGNPYVREIVLPKGFPVEEEIEGLRGFPSLVCVRVHPDDPDFLDDGGVVYTRKGELIFYPQGRKDTVFRIREGTESVWEKAFGEIPHLETVILPATLKTISGWARNSLISKATIEVDPGNPLLRIEDGLILDGTCLRGPSRETEGMVVVPEGVTEIGEEAFLFRLGIRKVVLPLTLKVIRENAFHGCASLVKMNLPEGLEEIGKDAFTWCGNLKSIRVPKSLSARGAACGLEGWLYLESENLMEIQMPFRSLREAVECSSFDNFFTTGFLQKREEILREKFLRGCLTMIREDAGGEAEVMAEDIPEIISWVQAHGDTEDVAMVVDYSHRHYGDLEQHSDMTL